MDSGLSQRSQRALGHLLPTFATSAPPPPSQQQQQQQHVQPTIDLSRALNEAVHPELLEFFQSTQETNVASEAFAAPAASLNGGDPRLRHALATFFNAYFNPIHTVKPDHIVLTSGATDAVENVVHAICDDGDCVLAPGPHWPGFATILKRRSNVNLIVAKPPTYSHWDNYLLPSLQAAYDFSDQRIRIKAVLLCNPNNPLSRCYPRSALLELMEFCQERGLHLICDEVFGLLDLHGTDDKAPGFMSALSLTEPLVPEGAVKVDASRVHVVWSPSKLFGLSGFRVGCLISQQNPLLLRATALTAAHPSTLSTSFLASLLSWSQLPTLLALNRERLSHSYRILADALQKLNVPFIPASHGLFVFARLAKRATIEQQETHFFAALAHHGIKVAPGRSFNGVERDYGWARLRFSLPVQQMQDLVRRLELFLHSS
ncbi:uncharacterized protein SETTUDRAFT_178211 [Exserohilum turcica Et28A]|uniref:Aminotransferase class I/classII large domain-containing protein n=1 Tax=Exserohilum turcicum (strain 28A) TaxID=671987 RepID=R0KS45_EXST2|nr:uncharacterized protein SETTUDRAFT_178211 [Exserohilum turcica Et28A]EOA91804.1 hypothetical protein SETTUDRAFT_178211 [Exserohilum turcica Et28A]